MEEHYTKILVFAGSTRKDSTNKKLAALAAVEIDKIERAKATLIDLKQYPLPIYDGDLEIEQGYPENAARLKELFLNHHGVLLCCPEYNSSITGVLKNTIDWISRSDRAGTDLSAFTGKVMAISSAAPGKLGGLRGLVHVRSILSNLGTIVIPNQLAIPASLTAFEETGALKEDAQAKQFRDVLTTLVDTARRYKINLHAYCETLFKDYYIK